MLLRNGCSDWPGTRTPPHRGRARGLQGLFDPLGLEGLSKEREALLGSALPGLEQGLSQIHPHTAPPAMDAPVVQPSGRRLAPPCGTPLTKYLPIDRRDRLDGPPPLGVIGHPALGHGHELGRQRDLLGPAAGEGDTQVGSTVELSPGATTTRFPAAHPAHEDASAHDLRQGRKIAHDSTTSVEKTLHILHLYRCKTIC